MQPPVGCSYAGRFIRWTSPLLLFSPLNPGTHNEIQIKKQARHDERTPETYKEQERNRAAP